MEDFIATYKSLCKNEGLDRQFEVRFVWDGPVDTTYNPQNQCGTMTKNGLLRGENELGKYSLVDDAWVLRRDKRPEVVIGTGGTRRFDWPERA